MSGNARKSTMHVCLNISHQYTLHTGIIDGVSVFLHVTARFSENMATCTKYQIVKTNKHINSLFSQNIFFIHIKVRLYPIQHPNRRFHSVRELNIEATCPSR